MTARGVILNIIDWIRRKLNIEPTVTELQQTNNESDVIRYKDTCYNLNVTATIANALSNRTIGDSSVSIIEDNQRATFLSKCLDSVWEKARNIANRAYGTGEVVLYPTTDGIDIWPRLVDKDCLQVIRASGDKIKEALIISDFTVYNGVEYVRVDIHTIGDNYTIRSYAKGRNSDVLLPLNVVPEWSDIEPELYFGSVNKMLFGVIKCPTDNRSAESIYGVPITYGLDNLLCIREEFINWLRQEFDLKQVRLGVSVDVINNLPDNRRIDDRLAKLYMKFDTDPNQGYFQVFDPATREQSVINAIEFIDGLIEKGIGANKGLLTDVETSTATATAIRAATYDTWSLINGMRRNIEQGIQDYIDACNVMANGYSDTPALPIGKYSINFDWDTSLLESTEQMFNQLNMLNDKGLASGVRLNQFVTGQSLKDAEAEIAGIPTQKTFDIAQMLQ